MTVADLIAELEALDHDAEIYVHHVKTGDWFELDGTGTKGDLIEEDDEIDIPDEVERTSCILLISG